ncbi:hypothetical protein [Pseudoalteromonas spongiae]|uniref:hypothetical protein n=1 Tax=Pseudoalteromonas spongiae TaxID=298657 RepID=UPI000C2D63E2|nr:hypothetical protein [Pseudoalteromonas spongiae]
MDIYDWYLNFFEMGSDKNISDHIMLLVIALMFIATVISLIKRFYGYTNTPTFLTTAIVTASYFSTDSILALMFEVYEIETFTGIANLYLIFTIFDAATVLAILLITPWFRKEGQKTIQTMTSIIALLLMINATNNFLMSLHIAFSKEPNMYIYMAYTTTIIVVDLSIVFVMMLPKLATRIANRVLKRERTEDVSLVRG